MSENSLTHNTQFWDQRTWWQRLRNKIPPFPARTVYISLMFNTGKGWHQAEAQVDAPDGVGKLQLKLAAQVDGKEVAYFDDLNTGDQNGVAGFVRSAGYDGRLDDASG